MFFCFLALSNADEHCMPAHTCSVKNINMMCAMQDTAVSNALVTFLVPVVQNVLPNATAAVAVLNNFTVSSLTASSCLLHMRLQMLLCFFCR